MKNEIEHIQQLIQKARTDEALAQLQLLFAGKKAFREHARLTTLLQAEFSGLKQRELGGLLTSDERQVAENRIQDRILKLTAAIEQPELLRELQSAYPRPSVLTGWTAPMLGIAILVLLLIAFFNRGGEAATFDLTVYFYGDETKSHLLKRGSIQFTYAGKPETKEIDQEGRVVLSDLSADLRSDTLFLHPEIPGYSSRRLALLIPQERDHLEVIVEARKEEQLVRGQILDRTGQPIAGTLVRVAGKEATTDGFGEFELKLPYNTPAVQRIQVFRADRLLYSGEETIGEVPIKIKVNTGYE